MMLLEQRVQLRLRLERRVEQSTVATRQVRVAGVRRRVRLCRSREQSHHFCHAGRELASRRDDALEIALFRGEIVVLAGKCAQLLVLGGKRRLGECLCVRHDRVAAAEPPPAAAAWLHVVK